MKLTFVNVGYGEAVLAQYPDPVLEGKTRTLLVDGGSGCRQEYEDRASGRIALEEYLRMKNIRPDIAAVTHIHEDHLCGLAALPDELLPSTLWQSLPAAFCRKEMRFISCKGETESQEKFIRALNDMPELVKRVERRGGKVKTLRTGERLVLSSQLAVEVLSPSLRRSGEMERQMRALGEAESPEQFLYRLNALDAVMNNYSLILRLDFGGVRILLPGDANADGYGEIPREALRAQIFKVGHHGQRDGADEEVLQAVAPQIMVCCASSDRRYNSADPGLLRMAAEMGIELYFSDCPELPPEIPAPPPHHALEIEIGESGSIQTSYLGIEGEEQR